MSEMKKDVHPRSNAHPDFEADGAASAEATPPQGPPENAETQATASIQNPEIERLQQELDAARRRVDELARAYQALNQDREEFKQRLNRERERMIDVEKGKVALSLLEAIDELDRCLTAAPDDHSPLAKGVRLIRGNLLSKANAAGIERLELVGKPYDPMSAEAVDMEITPDEDRDQEVVSEITAGYRLKDRIVRPARVKVAKYVKPADA